MIRIDINLRHVMIKGVFRLIDRVIRNCLMAGIIPNPLFAPCTSRIPFHVVMALQSQRNANNQFLKHDLQYLNTQADQRRLVVCNKPSAISPPFDRKMNEWP